MREIFGDCECGIICENSDEGLFEAMKKVLDNPVLLKKFSLSEKERSKEFSMATRIKAMEEFIDSI
jgi:glycosyltransferase involved in cell wall biosynthesis